MTVLLTELLVLAVVLMINRRGSPQMAARLLAVSLPLFSSGLMACAGQGFGDVSVLILPASLILCGLLLDRVTLVAVTLLTIACTVAVMLGEARGLLAGPEPLNPASDIPDAVIILVITALGVGMLAGRLRESHARLRRQEAELRASEARYRGLVELAADAIVVSAPDTGIVEANHRASELSGCSREELLGLPLDALFGAEELARVPFRYDLTNQGLIVVIERFLTRKDGVRVPVEMSSRRMPDGRYQTILRDVSERHRAEAERVALEARLQQSQKMEAVGRLAGGVAHDFNNLLTVILGYTEIVLDDLGPEHRSAGDLEAVKRSGEQARSLVDQLLTLSRHRVVQAGPVSSNATIASLHEVLVRLVGNDVELDVLTFDVPNVVIDQSQLEQVVLNLVINARDAMPDGGRLTVATATGQLRSGAPSVDIRITDTGV
ncbi:MAG TPA: PAS domain S-box protein, partial [Vicinamibacteria bacterium]